MMDILFETERLIVKETDEKAEQQLADTKKEALSAESLFIGLPEKAMSEAIEDTAAVITFVQNLAASRNIKDKKHFGAWDRSGNLVAYAGASSWSTGVPELQITVAPEYQRQGYATEFLSALIRWAFQNYELDYFIYRHLANNLISGRLAMKLGGVLQLPSNKIEELTIKTYFIYK